MAQIKIKTWLFLIIAILLIISGTAVFAEKRDLYKGLEKLDPQKSAKTSVVGSGEDPSPKDFSDIARSNRERIMKAENELKIPKPTPSEEIPKPQAESRDAAPCGINGTPIIKAWKIAGCIFE